jgi:hypothetical protein
MAQPRASFGLEVLGNGPAWPATASRGLGFKRRPESSADEIGFVGFSQARTSKKYQFRRQIVVATLEIAD